MTCYTGPTALRYAKKWRALVAAAAFLASSKNCALAAAANDPEHPSSRYGQLRRVSVVNYDERKTQEIRRGKKDNIFEPSSNDGTEETDPPAYGETFSPSPTPITRSPTTLPIRTPMTLLPTTRDLPTAVPSPYPTLKPSADEPSFIRPSARPSVREKQSVAPSPGLTGTPRSSTISESTTAPSIRSSARPSVREKQSVAPSPGLTGTPWSGSPTISEPATPPFGGVLTFGENSPSVEPSFSSAPSPVEEGKEGGDRNSSFVAELSEKPYTHQDDNSSVSIDQLNVQGVKQDMKDHTVPVILTGFASATVFCALFILCASQRDRFLKRKLEAELQQRAALADDNSSEKSMMVDNDFEELMDEDEEQSGLGGSNRSMPTWIHAMMQELAHYGPSKYSPPPNILPPLHDGDEQRDDVDLDLRQEEEENDINPEELSLSRVSTLTTSLMDGSGYFYSDDVEPRDIGTTCEQVNIDSGGSQELIDPSIRAAMKKVRKSPSRDEESNSSVCSSSVCSSLTDGTNNTNLSAASTLLGEDCVASVTEELAPGSQADDKDLSKKSIFKTILDRMDRREDLSSDAVDTRSTQSLTESSLSRSEQRDGISLTGEMKKLEKLISSIKPAEALDSRKQDSAPSVTKAEHAVVRDVFASCTAEGSPVIGLTIKDAKSESYSPMVSSVARSSPFAGKVFPGDVVLRVNDVEAAGFSSAKLLKSIEAADTKTLKLTVLSTLPCKPHSSIDYGIVAGREEV